VNSQTNEITILKDYKKAGIELRRAGKGNLATTIIAF
jgi:hypothetical protein